MISPVAGSAVSTNTGRAQSARLTIDVEGLSVGGINVLAVEDPMLDEQGRVVETELTVSVVLF